jgi:hypothetical protein
MARTPPLPLLQLMILWQGMGYRQYRRCHIRLRRPCALSSAGTLMAKMPTTCGCGGCGLGTHSLLSRPT